MFNYITIYHQVHPDKIVLKGQFPDVSNGRWSEPSYVSAAVFAVAAWLCSDVSIPDESHVNVVKFITAPGVDPEYGFMFLRQIRGKGVVYDRLKGLEEFRNLAGDMMSMRLELCR